MELGEERDAISEGLASEGLGALREEALGALEALAQAVGPRVRCKLVGAVEPHVRLAMAEALGALDRTADGALGAHVRQVVEAVVPLANLYSTKRSCRQ